MYSNDELHNYNYAQVYRNLLQRTPNGPSTLASASLVTGDWAIKLGRQNGRLLYWPKCRCVSMKTNFGSFCCGESFVCQVWLSSGPPELLPQKPLFAHSLKMIPGGLSQTKHCKIIAKLALHTYC